MNLAQDLKAKVCWKYPFVVDLSQIAAPAATNSDPQGRALNRRVDVKVIVSKGLSEAI